MKSSDVKKLSPVVERHYHILTLLELAADAVEKARQLIPVVDEDKTKEVLATDEFLGKLFDIENDLWMYHDLVKNVVKKGGIKDVD